MVHLILAVIAITLTSALVLVSVNYLPAWRAEAQLSYEQALRGFERLERAYEVYAKTNADEPATVTMAADGGLTEHFEPLLGFVPRAPQGYVWSYGQRPVEAGGDYAGMHYFCLSPASPQGGTEGTIRALLRFRSVAPLGQTVYAQACGAGTDWVAPTTYPQPLHVTYYVFYVPEMHE